MFLEKFLKKLTILSTYPQQNQNQKKLKEK